MAELDEIECRFPSRQQWNSQFANDFWLDNWFVVPCFYWLENTISRVSIEKPNLLSPPLTNSRNFDTSRRWTPNQTIDRSNERKRERICWASLAVCRYNDRKCFYYIRCGVGWGFVVISLCVTCGRADTHTHIAMWTSMTVVSQIIGKKKRYLPRDSDGLVVGLLLRTCSSSSAKGLEGKEEKSCCCCCCCCRHTHTERVKKRKKKYIGQSIVGGKSRPRWVGISYILPRLLRLLLPQTARARNRKEKKLTPSLLFSPSRSCCCCCCVYM